jgi:hypothetical protein
LSGKFQSSFQDGQFGNGTLTVTYLFPSIVSVGSNLTGGVSLQINQLNGLQEFLTIYEISVLLTLPNGRGLTQYVSSTGQLYPGAIWNPSNLTILVTQENTGLASGQAVNASVSIRLDTTTAVGFPVYEYHPHTDAKAIGEITIANGRTVGTGGDQGNSGLALYLPYVLVGVGVALVSFGVTYPRLFRESR